MKPMKPLAFAAYTVLAFSFLVISFGSESALGNENIKKLRVSIEIFSGRPNPTFEITDAMAIDEFREKLSNLPPAEITDEEKQQFSRLGYRGILINNAAGIEGIPENVQILNGKVKVYGGKLEEIQFLDDTMGLESNYLDLARQNGLTWPEETK